MSSYAMAFVVTGGGCPKCWSAGAVLAELARFTGVVELQGELLLVRSLCLGLYRVCCTLGVFARSYAGDWLGSLGARIVALRR